MTPVAHADKGFNVSVFPQADFEACTHPQEQRRGFCHTLDAFTAPGVRSFDHAEHVAAGTWSLYVRNGANILNAATVRVHVTAKPVE